MKNLLKLSIFIFSLFLFSSCSENYSNGERIGLVTQFSNTGVFWKTWEGHLNLTQTGMNSSSTTPFDFSIDNDRQDENIIKTIDSAATYGWKIKITYHETFGKNWFGNRGETNHFITKVDILDRNMTSNSLNTVQSHTKKVNSFSQSKDTVYIEIKGNIIKIY